MLKPTIFMSFSLGNTSVSDYFVDLAVKLDTSYKVVLFSDRPKPENIVLPESIEVKYWPSKRPTKFKDGYFLFTNTKKYKPVLTISVFGSVNIFLVTGWICNIPNRVAWVRTLSTQFPQKRMNILRKSFVYKLATQIITNSEATKQDVVDNFRVLPSKIKVLPNSVKDYNNTLEDVVVVRNKIVYVGRLHPSKGVDVLIQAVSILLKKGHNIHLDIIGNGLFQEKLFEQVEQLGIKDYVCFLGGKMKEEVLTAFKKAYCAVIPSYSEAFGFTVIEAMSVGTCVIGANNTGIKEIIVPEQTGLLFETGNALDLATKLELVFNNFEMRNELSQNGFERFLNRYETNYAVNRDFLFFNNLLS
jgi:glycosyltransferase involved in cell wall biosynthesis